MNVTVIFACILFFVYRGTINYITFAVTFVLLALTWFFTGIGRYAEVSLPLISCTSRGKVPPPPIIIQSFDRFFPDKKVQKSLIFTDFIHGFEPLDFAIYTR